MDIPPYNFIKYMLGGCCCKFVEFNRFNLSVFFLFVQLKKIKQKDLLIFFIIISFIMFVLNATTQIRTLWYIVHCTHPELYFQN